MIGKSRRGLAFGKQRDMGIAGIGLRTGRVEARLGLRRGTRALLGRRPRQQRRQIDLHRAFT